MLELYTIDGCSRCHLVKLRLNELAIPFIEKNLFEEPRYVEELLKLNQPLVTPTLVDEARVFTGKALWDELELNK
ncbi:glutaredoxin family protein [Exiguobacterium sp. SL-10]|jgi:arsenate reductase-like glutaredoxin family protein|uniref:glutaredoxin family protein n=1 Tax=unclassified Exiguobacterium TaxID=2644629 RepID=UPI001039DFC6|nr:MULTISPECIES: glutaredoxin family protein [unclassified Exiguobacterium]TCI21669.1 glutaredoxin family protein [Exiguobacterium sp. SL-9]TCI29696.1 glutaredoxin family protein [Exiguobacterium sp. SL-10]